MVAPVTGPFSSNEELLGPPNSLGQRTVWYSKSKSWQRQKKPYNLPLTFSFKVKFIDSFNKTNPDGSLSMSQCSSLVEPHVWDPSGAASQRSFNKARAALIEELKPAQAELGAAVAEWRQSVGMISQRALQLARAASAIRRYRVKEALNILGVSAPSKGAEPIIRKGSKNFANNLLEIRFGWLPLIRDVDNALKTLTGGLPSIRVHGRGVDSGSWATDSGVVNNQRSKTSGTYKSSHRITARVGAINPNLALANQLGLVNPASVAWEVIPYSFLFDYWVNVGQFLSGFTDLLGYDLLDTNWTWRVTASSHDSVQWNMNQPQPGSADWTAHKFELKRTVGSIPNFFLTSQFKNVFRPTYDKEGNLNAPWRAATTIGLLLQKLPPKG